MVVLLAGLPGTGKTTLAKALLERAPGVRLDKDTIRAALFAPADIDYSKEQDDLCVRILLDAAGYLLRKDPQRLILLDGRTFSRHSDLEQIQTWAAQHGSPTLVIECVCSEVTARRRLEHGPQEHLAANRDFALYRQIKAAFEPIPAPKLVIDTEQPLELCVRRCLDALYAPSA